MNTTHLFAPIAIAMGLAAAAPAQANGGVAVGVALPPVVVDVNGVLVTIGHPPPPPPPVVVYEQAPREVVIVREPVYVERDVVVIHRDRPAVVYYEDDGCGKRGKGHHKHGKYKHGKDHGHGGHYTYVQHRGGHRR